MTEERIGVHDRYQIEITRSYPLAAAPRTRCEWNTYIFLPAALGLSSHTYSGADYYRDVQNYLRLSAPRYTMENLLSSEKSPLVRIEKALERLPEDACERQADELAEFVKLLHCSVRETLSDLRHEDAASRRKLPQRLLEFRGNLLGRFRACHEKARAMGSVQLCNAFRFTDEGLSLTLEDALLELYEAVEPGSSGKRKKQIKQRIRAAVVAEQRYRAALPSGFAPSTAASEEWLEHLSTLKKHAAEALYLRTERRAEGKAIEHFALAAAAGMAMAFATALTFWSQSFWRSFSVQLFLAFVVGYMFKDRIKEVLRVWLSRLLRRRMDDHRVLIRSGDGRRVLGVLRERLRFSNRRELPPNVLHVRKGGSPYRDSDPRQEAVLVHRKQVVLKSAAFEGLRPIQVGSGAVVDISRLDVRPFLRKMDDPVERKRRFHGDRLEIIRLRRTYSVYIVTECKTPHDGQNGRYHGVRVVLDRKGIRAIEALDERSEAERDSAA